MSLNIPNSSKKRVIIAGGGFAGLKLANKLNDTEFQVVLLDRNNYHQFQPLFYQVATAGLEPSSISFPLRKVFQNSGNIIIRVAEIMSIDHDLQEITTNLGAVHFDYLVIATGTETNFFGIQHIRQYAIPMKSVSEALGLRNHILQNFEDALTCTDPERLESLLTIAVVGGGPTGVEISGTLAEMKKYILPKDYGELDFNKMQIHLIEAGDRILNGMSQISSLKASKYLEKLGVRVRLNSQVSDYDGITVTIKDGLNIKANTLVWAAGVTVKKIAGLPEGIFANGNRILVDKFNRVEGLENIFAIGDIAIMKDAKNPSGHPQLAQPAMQQAKLLAKNLSRLQHGQSLKQFNYWNKGTMATIGRNLAVVDLPFISFQGFFAWLTWMFVHLMSIVGVKNRMLIFINWLWNYLTYDQSLRLIIKPYKKGNI
jgi:NADH:ubiquinone reductase (H+-translocating)